jgi:hypothetical protein
MFQIRQGDVLVTSSRARRFDGDAAPKISKKHKVPRENGRLVLAHGEATGHAHAIKDRGVALFRAPQLRALLLCVSKEGAELVHDEHETIAIPPGSYRVVRQREYDPLAIHDVED